MKILFNKTYKNYLLLMLTIFASELIFKAVVKSPVLDWSTLRILIGVNIIALVLGFLYSLLGRIAGNIFTFLTSVGLSIYEIVQAGFLNYLGVYMSINTTSQAGAVKDYISDYIASFDWKFWLILIPQVLLLIYYIFLERKVKTLEENRKINFLEKYDTDDKKKKAEKKQNRKRRINTIINVTVFTALFCVAYYYSLSAKFMQNDLQLKSTKSLFKNPDIPNIAVSQFGCSGYLVLDLKNAINPPEEEIETEFDQTFTKIEQVETDYTRHIDDSVWEKIIASETNRNYKTLSNYFISQRITDKNDYTGLFKDKNLILIMMESTTNIAINEEYFPNLYKLYSEGWAWTNAYSPRNSCSTGNNEMSGMVSLFTINNSCTANYYKNNVYPESIFNLFNRAGYQTTSYHNYTEQYYYRKTIHPNMGSGHYYGVQELGIPYSNIYQEWPSDVELIKKVLEKTQDQEKFMAWVTSVSAHQPYTISSTLGDKHKSLFANTKYNNSLKRYLSKLKEFDLAIGALIDGLTEQGKLDDTVIVLYADHYPYGLTTSTLNSYFDYNVTKRHEVDRTPFIIYNSQMTPEIHEEYTSYMNIVPTVANLFDFDFDPRLYAGRDVLSKDYEDRVIFADGSWQDHVAYYNAQTGKITYIQDEKTYSQEEIKNINSDIKNRISMSNLAIRKNYFNYLFKEFDKYKVEVVEEQPEETKEINDNSETENQETPTN